LKESSLRPDVRQKQQKQLKPYKELFPFSAVRIKIGNHHIADEYHRQRSMFVLVVRVDPGHRAQAGFDVIGVKGMHLVFKPAFLGHQHRAMILLRQTSCAPWNRCRVGPVSVISGSGSG
jgi:hypothetical protein